MIVITFLIVAFVLPVGVMFVAFGAANSKTSKRHIKLGVATGLMGVFLAVLSYFGSLPIILIGLFILLMIIGFTVFVLPVSNDPLSIGPETEKLVEVQQKRWRQTIRSAQVVNLLAAIRRFLDRVYVGQSDETTSAPEKSKNEFIRLADGQLAEVIEADTEEVAQKPKRKRGE
jgi:hypothetical protein